MTVSTATQFSMANEALPADSRVWPPSAGAGWISPHGEAGLVSVMMAAFNCALYIESAVESVFAQIYRPIELIVVDDGSSDGTCELIERLSAKARNLEGLTLRNLKLEHCGQCHALNYGLRQSRGEFIQYLDADDLLAPEKIGTHVRALQEDPTVEMVFGRTFVFQEHPNESQEAEYGIDSDVTLDDVCQECSWHLMGPLYRRSLCYRVGPWYEELCRRVDWEYGVRVVLTAHGFKSVPNGISYYRRGHALHKQRPALPPLPWLKSYLKACQMNWRNIERCDSVTAGSTDALARWALRTALAMSQQGAITDAQECLAFARELPTTLNRRAAVQGFGTLLKVLGPIRTYKAVAGVIAGKNSLRRLMRGGRP